jgi:hypothetical protein
MDSNHDKVIQSHIKSDPANNLLENTLPAGRSAELADFFSGRSASVRMSASVPVDRTERLLQFHKPRNVQNRFG